VVSATKAEVTFVADSALDAAWLSEQMATDETHTHTHWFNGIKYDKM